MSGVWLGLRGLWYRIFGPRYTAPILTADVVPIVPAPLDVDADEPVSNAVFESMASSLQPEVARSRDTIRTPTESAVSEPDVQVGEDAHHVAAPAQEPIDTFRRSAAHPGSDPEPRASRAGNGWGGRQAPRTLRLGAPLGHGGGQGTVHVLLGEPQYVYKRYHRPMQDAAGAYRDLVAAGKLVLPVLDRYGIVAVWPEEVCGYSTTVEGYVMKRIPPDFRIDLLTPYGRKNVLATLDHALPRSPESKFRPAEEAMAEERLEMVWSIGRFLNTLHRNDLVYGDLSFKNVLFALNPVRVLFMDIDSVRRLSAPVIPEKDLVNTPDWADPMSEDRLPLGFDLDRYKFSLLVYRLLLGGGASGRPPADASLAAQILGLDDKARTARRLESLTIRAAKGPTGSRPSLGEWMDVLGDIRSAG